MEQIQQNNAELLIIQGVLSKENMAITIGGFTVEESKMKDIFRMKVDLHSCVFSIFKKSQ